MIVRVTGEVRVLFGRVDADGDVVNETPLTFPIGKFCDEEWARVFAEIQAKHQELSEAYASYSVSPTEAVEEAEPTGQGVLIGEVVEAAEDDEDDEDDEAAEDDE